MAEKIKIKRNKKAVDYTTTSKEQLMSSTLNHITDVEKGIRFIIGGLEHASLIHDWTKLSLSTDFYNSFKSGFENRTWYNNHVKMERHHITHPDGQHDDVNIIDLIEHIVDCVMAGLGRKGHVTPVEVPNELLQKIIKNTVDLLIKNIEVSESATTEAMKK